MVNFFSKIVWTAKEFLSFNLAREELFSVNLTRRPEKLPTPELDSHKSSRENGILVKIIKTINNLVAPVFSEFINQAFY